MLFIILLFVIKLNSNFKEQLKNFPNLKPTLTMVRIQYMRSTHRWSQIGQEGSGGYCIPPMHQDAFYVTKVGVLPIWIVKSNILSVGPTSERNRRNIRLYYPYRQYTNLFIFRFVSVLCLCSKQCLLHSM